MKSKKTFRRWLTLLVMLAATLGSVSLAQEITLWYSPLVYENPAREPLVEWVESHAPDYLPEGYTLAQDYGPPTYSEVEQRYIVQARSGKPDVVEGVLENMIALQKAGLIQPVTEQFGGWDEQGDFVPSTIDALTIDGELYGLPYNSNARVLLYRKDILEKHGLEVPTTWEELASVASAITENEPDMYGLGLTTAAGSPRTFQEFISFFFQVNNGENMFTREEGSDAWTINTTPEILAQVLELYQNLYFGSDPAAVNVDERGSDYTATDLNYVSGRTAMVPMGPWLYSYRDQDETARQILEENTGIIALPLPEGGTQATYLEVKPIMINTATENPEAAWELLKMLASAEHIQLVSELTGVNPPREDVASTPEFQENWWQQAFVAELPTGVALAPVNWGFVSNDLTDAVQRVIYQDGSPEEVAQDLYDTLLQRAADGQL